jgi:uncharacterized protein
MPVEPVLLAELALLGIVTGFLAGLLGIGGAMIMVPFVTIVLTHRGFPADYTVKMAVATSLATICFTSLSSMRAHHQHGAVRWKVAALLSPGIIVGAIAGAQLSAALPGRSLANLVALFIAFSATQMLIDRKPKPTRTLPGPAGMFGAGGVIGVASAMLGAGGAFMSVPFMTWCNVKIHDAVGTASAIGFPIARDRSAMCTCPRCSPSAPRAFFSRRWVRAPRTAWTSGPCGAFSRWCSTRSLHTSSSTDGKKKT